MIVFHGDSFTWGSGLQYHCLVEEYGYTWEQCNQFLPNKCRLEQFPKKIDDYRIKHSFANLVSNHFDVPYILSLNGNGGDNTIIKQRIFASENDYHPGYHFAEIDLHIIQLSAPLRGNPNITDTSDINRLVYLEVLDIIKKVDALPKLQKNDYLFLCWFEEHAEIIKSICPNQLIYINYNNVLYDSFSKLTQTKLSFKKYGLNDLHFTKEGHKIIANSIIDKIKENNLKFDLLDI